MGELPRTMRAVVLTGHGGLDKLVYREDVPVPEPEPGEVLIKVAACGMNNTDVNTRTAWYSDTVTSGVTTDGGAEGFASIREEAASWGRSRLTFPRVQGADAVGRIVAVGSGVAPSRIGERVMVDGWLRDPDDPLDIEKAGYFGSECDGGYAEFTVAPEANAVVVTSDLSDVELATFMVACSTAEGMIRHVHPEPGDWVLVTGASGGVGTAAIQLLKRRGANVIALAGRAKADALRTLGADAVIARDTSDLVGEVAAITPSGLVEGVVDVVGGPMFGDVIRSMRQGARYASSGAIAGPMVTFDLRLLVYRDLEFHGSTVTPLDVFRDVVGYIEKKEIRPVVAAVYPLARLAEAQAKFLKKDFVGNIVIAIEEHP